MTKLKVYIGCPEDDLSNDYLCLDINLSNGDEIPVEQSEYLGSYADSDFLKVFEGTLNRANYLSKELSIPISIDLDEIISTCIDQNCSESTINSVRSLVKELRRKL